MLFLKAYDQFQENRKRRARERAGDIAEGRAKGRAEARAEILEQLKARGLDVDEFIPPDDPENNKPGWLFPVGDGFHHPGFGNQSAPIPGVVTRML